MNGGGGASNNAGSAGNGAAGGGIDEIRCAANQPVCDGNRATICNDTGDGYTIAGEACTSTQTCVAGSCEELECAPNERFCEGAVVRKCADNGLSSTEVTSCARHEYCDAASATCKTGVCSPGEPACDGTRATTCNASGSDFEAGGKLHLYGDLHRWRMRAAGVQAQLDLLPGPRREDLLADGPELDGGRNLCRQGLCRSRQRCELHGRVRPGPGQMLGQWRADVQCQRRLGRCGGLSGDRAALHGRRVQGTAQLLRAQQRLRRERHRQLLLLVCHSWRHLQPQQ